MRKLDTVQKREKLNEVHAVDEKGNGNANHRYAIVYKRGIENIGESTIVFQEGARNIEESKHGVLDPDLLEIVRDRLKGFQGGEYATESNEKALYHVEEALKQLNKRVEDRIKRNVLGTTNK